MTDEEKARIQQMAAEGTSALQIAKEVGRSYPAVLRVVQGVTGKRRGKKAAKARGRPPGRKAGRRKAGGGANAARREFEAALDRLLEAEAESARDRLLADLQGAIGR